MVESSCLNLGAANSNISDVWVSTVSELTQFWKLKESLKRNMKSKLKRVRRPQRTGRNSEKGTINCDEGIIPVAGEKSQPSK